MTEQDIKPEYRKLDNVKKYRKKFMKARSLNQKTVNLTKK